MPHQTVNSPCFSCNKSTCIGCEHELMRDWVDVKRNFPSQEALDPFIENLFREMTDIVWDEEPNTGILLLGQKFHGFPVGEFNMDDWLHFLENHHSKGVGWISENISPYDYSSGENKLYRLELAFDGKHQEIGIFQGQDEAGFSEELIEHFIQAFKGLPCPVISEPVVFWFTLHGLKTFRNPIDALIQTYAERNWQVLAACMEYNCERALYQDLCQVGVSPSCLDSSTVSFIEIQSIDALLTKEP